MTVHENGEIAIRRRIGELIEGLRAKDLDGVAAVYAPDVVSFDIEPPLQHVGVAAKMKNWERAFAVFAELDYELRDLTITVGGGVAFGHGFGRLSGTFQNGVKTPGMWVRATFCLKETDGEWLVAHDQVSVPLDIATGTGVVDLEP